MTIINTLVTWSSFYKPTVPIPTYSVDSHSGHWTLLEGGMGGGGGGLEPWRRGVIALIFYISITGYNTKHWKIAPSYGSLKPKQGRHVYNTQKGGHNPDPWVYQLMEARGG